MGGSAKPGKPKVLFISSFGRSGSTLLEKILANVPGVCVCGEVVHFWSGRSVCSCGAKQSECEFWAPLWAEIERSFGNPSRFFAQTRYSLRPPFFLRVFLGKPWWSGEWEEALLKLFELILLRANLIVDSSKLPQVLWTLLELWRKGKIELWVVHLIRRPEGIAWSVKARGSPTLKTVSRALVTWNLSNTAFLFLALRYREARIRILRYERFCSDPAGAVRGIGEFAGIPIPPELSDMLSRKKVFFPRTHQIEGNRIRFRTGEVEIKCDEGKLGLLELARARLFTPVAPVLELLRAVPEI